MAPRYRHFESRLEDDFSLIERLADEIRTEEDVTLTAEDRSAVVQDLYEGPKKCKCCINWLTECPHDVDLAALEKEDKDEEEASPLVVRRRVTPGPAGSVLSIHSIEVRHAATRKVLIDVFQPYDGIVQDIKYLAFLAPFHQFFWRWEKFEDAVAAEKDEAVRKILGTLRWIVRRELAEAFAVSKELSRNGVITSQYLWTLFPPGELVYTVEDGDEQFFVLRSIVPGSLNDYTLTGTYVDWDGNQFGTATRNITLRWFPGTRRIDCLKAFPAKYHKRFEELRERLTERGRKFVSLAGKHYKAYRDPDATDPEAEQRVMIDALQRRNEFLNRVWAESYVFDQSTDSITQAPVDEPPARGHVPLTRRRRDRDDDQSEYEYKRRRAQRLESPEFRPRTPPTPVYEPTSPVYEPAIPMRRHPRPRRSSRTPRRSMSPPTPGRLSPAGSDAGTDEERQRVEIEELRAARARKPLSDLQLSVCVPRVVGYDLKAKRWKSFKVDRISDIEWNTSPFESLVLPDGYKDLILAFVESQVKDKNRFDDVINGKGGGLVALLAGDPGVGKTLTAESVAEKIKAPLFKMELSDYTDDVDDRSSCAPSPTYHPYPDRYVAQTNDRRGDFTVAFELAARWGAVLLIDECDIYLEQRSDASSGRNRMVSRFLKELEYYPSLLFLTTNRERALDQAVYSRVHLNINYPALDAPSREKIWRTFLEKGGAVMEENEYAALSKIEVNGRRIRNIVRTASIMARRGNRPVQFDDISKVMKITEGLQIEGPGC
ncbi:hypothetical protein CMUS01_04359 [Colletotrichum musicola]|uniref:AAA+ ATPase domain-containing protein n=1 Tax=Colletotrichum musicola TaxID=2175873 RepID=A0A8H6NMR9_9PEZI|nr:hypothetical protein CMUS01_04359 [Colletotrichum musicola]